MPSSSNDAVADASQEIMAFRFLVFMLFVAFTAAFSGPVAVTHAARSQVSMAAKKAEKSGGFWSNVRPDQVQNTAKAPGTLSAAFCTVSDS